MQTICYHPKLITEPKTSPYPKNLNTFKMGEAFLDFALIAGYLYDMLRTDKIV